MIYKLSSLVFGIFMVPFYSTPVESVPEDYCLSALNTSDCGRPPTPVFYYYKPGSRCEIKFWRGCPTENLFRNEYHCSHHCIGKLSSSEQEEGPKYTCDVPIDTSKCKPNKELTYTYNIQSKKCTEVNYYGCPTKNKFRNMQECKDACEKSRAQWENEIKNLDLDELQNLNNLLDDLNTPSDDKEDLKKNVNDSKIRPHTVKDYDDVTDAPEDTTKNEDYDAKVVTEPEELTSKPQKTTSKAVATTSMPEKPTEKEEEPTANTEPSSNKPVETTKMEEQETTVAAVTTTSTEPTQPTTAAPVETTETREHTTRKRKKRSTRKPEEGEVVREGP